MDDAKHTKGPWRERRNQIVGFDNKVIARIVSTDDGGMDCASPAQAEVNTALIVAAPALLAFAEAHDAYMLDAGYSGPEDSALHPKAAANWRACRSALSRTEGAQS